MYSRIFEFVRNFVLKHSDMIRAVSDGKVEKLRGYVPKARVVNIMNGLDERFLENPNEDMYTILKHSQMSFVPLVNDKLKDSVPTKMFEALGVGCPVLLAAAGDSAAGPFGRFLPPAGPPWTGGLRGQPAAVRSMRAQRLLRPFCRAAKGSEESETQKR